jgi:hypothetical protein
VNPGGYRRLLPPARRRPGVLAVLLRWRAELLLAGIVAGMWQLTGAIGVAVAAGSIGLAAALTPEVRTSLRQVLSCVVTLHRVRAGLVQAGIADRSGRLPWLMWARPIGENSVLVSVWLRAGTTAGDLRDATAVLATACGAADVTVEHRTMRADRALLLVARPRWGWPGS